ncbi:MAG: hypothetical protein CSB48_11270 [Proteobacteria bacterium]|nr:MAG: hypothetical protein CSB48_11270 [Pseudomonadota bacterium]
MYQQVKVNNGVSNKKVRAYSMYMDTIIMTSLLTVGSVVIVTGAIIYFFAREGQKRDRADN